MPRQYRSVRGFGASIVTLLEPLAALSNAVRVLLFCFFRAPERGRAAVIQQSETSSHYGV
jgi:hypothetical protein